MRGGGVKGRLEFFRKIVCFGIATRPLKQNQSNTSFKTFVTDAPPHLHIFSMGTLINLEF